ncbi:hypothetical protein M0813_14504 [Anaeramoeba flamelloides]|uniref:GTPase n=1 Tax=Anaeramoeba flamelloides TaxID=1746091 RepID=A0AAV8AFH0_9EUKA|nr:hypothetical protein M0812_04140 [Anaeramoeba flamelloides]KAJ6252123.1 hypothetical protein M0813_14504 [Anaeramoeba flamelloides]
MTDRKKVLIIGAAGRDFHNFNCVFRDKEQFEVICFTAQQIPKIEGRTYPPSLAGKLYPEGIPIFPEIKLEELIKKHKIDTCYLSYSDLNHLDVMDLGSRVLSAGSNFELIAPKDTMIKSKKPVVAVVAVRTGCGKSQTSRYVAKMLREAGLTPVVIRHPMPYGDLEKQTWQRFGCYEDLEKHKVTIEEREEYEMHIKFGTIVYAGVDYFQILEQAEKEADVILWDGGNNDTPFYLPDLFITIADPLRVGHELTYYPGALNIRMASVIVINKANTATKEQLTQLKKNIAKVNPEAIVIVGASKVVAKNPENIKGKKVLLIEDGPTLTHGEMTFGAAKVAADQEGALEIIDPKPYLVGSLIDVFKKYSHVSGFLPAMGYWDEQIQDLEKTINAVPCDSVVIGTPMDLTTLINIEKPTSFVEYDLVDMDGELSLSTYVTKFIKEFCKKN